MVAPTLPKREALVVAKNSTWFGIGICVSILIIIVFFTSVLSTHTVSLSFILIAFTSNFIVCILVPCYFIRSLPNLNLYVSNFFEEKLKAILFTVVSGMVYGKSITNILRNIRANYTVRPFRASSKVTPTDLAKVI